MNLLDYLLTEYPELDPKAARGLIMRGDVLLNDCPQTSPGFKVNKETLRIRGSVYRETSRGSRKLGPVLDSAGIECNNLTCLDLGAADGGFTSVLLDRGAARVYAVDIAYGVLAHELRNNERVIPLERINARKLTTAEISEPVDLVVGDLSFIGWGAVLPAIRPLAADKAKLLLLVKPQFELAGAGKQELLKQGIVRDRELLKDCLKSLFDTWQNNDMVVVDIFPSPIKGRRGNQEFFVSLAISGMSMSEAEYSQRIDEILMELDK